MRIELVSWRSFIKKKWWIILLGCLPIILLSIPFSIPAYPTSTVLNDRDGKLLSAIIAQDGQWRFPLTDSVPQKFETCLLLFEDEYFYRHPGINPISFSRAIVQNIKAGKVISGASTLTMQLARMLRHQDRTYYQKMVEMWLALRIETHYSKRDILRHYASLAPFGGNVVGIDAAAWRYYGRPAHLLSWAESATLAVLPNDPGSIYPGRGIEKLRQKRNFVLQKLLNRRIIDSLTYNLCLAEPLPEKPFRIPQRATHLLTTLLPSQDGRQIHSSLSPFWQTKAINVTSRHHHVLKTNGIDNLAAMVINLKDGEVLAYVGNTNDSRADGYLVDVIQSPRSSGSILKPMLYAASLDRGLILPETLLTDVPSFFGGYSPKNFNLGYEGVIKANQALSMSLNIPFSHLLRDYTYEQFHQDLKNYGLTTLGNAPGRFGLSLILGGAEVKLWDLAQVYFSMYRKLSNEPNLKITTNSLPDTIPDILMEEINIWHTFQAMTELSRSGQDANWKNFTSSQKIAWKTGTSFGFRDAWAVGLNGEILVAVWVGNADGEGRAGLIGSSTAGPILNELIRASEYQSGWLEDLMPMGNELPVCEASGMLANEYCTETKIMTLGRNAEKSGLCSYHKTFWVDQSGNYTVNQSCYDFSIAQQKTLFILPPHQGNYYRKNHSNYEGRPAPYPGCPSSLENPLAITYPTPDTKVFIPRELDGQLGKVIIEASHQNTDTKLYWHLNDEYLGETTTDHRQALTLPKGDYLVTVMDEVGNAASRRFEVVSGENY